MVRSGLPKSHKSLLLQSLASSIQINNQMFQNKLPRGMADHEAVARSSTQEAELRLPGVKELLKLGASSKSHQAIIEDKRKSLSMAFNIKQLSLCVEVILAFHSFLKYGGALLRDENSIKDYNKSLNALLKNITMGIKRGGNTNQFKLQKFLECFHFLEDHILLGPPTTHNSDTGERGLKTWAKSPAATAQKRDDSTFLRQVAANLQEKDKKERAFW